MLRIFDLVAQVAPWTSCVLQSYYAWDASTCCLGRCMQHGIPRAVQPYSLWSDSRSTANHHGSGSRNRRL